MPHKKPFPATPGVHQRTVPPESCSDVVNNYGTYNIQATADTDDLFPMIAPGLPKAYRNMQLEKKDLPQ